MDKGIQIILDAVGERGVDGDYRDLGMIRTNRLENLLIFNYTEQAQYARCWGPVERVARGLIVNAATATVVARGFDKFFNLNESDEVSIDTLPRLPFEATVKEDGSLGVLYRRSDGWAIATRGSFNGPQAEWATKHLRANYDLAGHPDYVTLLFEIIYPENRVVLDYGQRCDLVLIGARGTDGYDYPHADVATFGLRYGFSVVNRYQVATLTDLLTLASRTKQAEGWVVRFTNGLRIKVKCQHYLDLHRCIFGLTAERIRDLLLVDEWNAFLPTIPEELQSSFAAQAQAFQDATAVEEQRVQAIYQQVLADVPDEDRKTFALRVLRHYPNERGLLFSLRDGRPISKAILKTIAVPTADKVAS